MNIELLERLTAVHKSLVEQSGTYAAQSSAGRYVDNTVADKAIKGVLDAITKLTCELPNV